MKRIPSGRPLVVGLIGGMGGGKSLVADAFRKRGAVVVAGDQLGHEALRQPAIRDQVCQRWGRGVLDDHGEVDRRKLGPVVFGNPAERNALETLVFPWIEARFREELQKARTNPHCKLFVMDAAVLLEAGWDSMADVIVFVHAPRVNRVERLMAQRGWTEEEVVAREHAQWPLAEKIARADFVIDNAGPPEEAARQVNDLIRQWELDSPLEEKIPQDSLGKTEEAADRIRPATRS